MVSSSRRDNVPPPEPKEDAAHGCLVKVAWLACTGGGLLLLLMILEEPAWTLTHKDPLALGVLAVGVAARFIDLTRYTEPAPPAAVARSRATRQAVVHGLGGLLLWVLAQSFEALG